MTQIKAIIYGFVAGAVMLIAGSIYWRGYSDATTKDDLRVARETIKSEREALVISHTIDMRVNAEGIQTAKTAQEATREIEVIRAARLDQPDRTASAAGNRTGSDRADDHAAARVLQLAREARAAALASSAKLQPARAGDR